LLAWFQLLGAYTSSCLTLNSYDLQLVTRAVQEIAQCLEFAETDKAHLYADKRADDRLQAAVDCPQVCAEALRAEYEREAAETVVQGSRRRRRGAPPPPPTPRPRRRTQRLFVPLDRSPMDDFDHLLTDLAFEDDARRVDTRITGIKLRQQGIRRAQLLATSIGEVLRRVQQTVAQLVAQLTQLLHTWTAERIRIGDHTAPLTLTQKLTFQHQLKTTLLDLRTYTTSQRVDGTISIAQRCNGIGIYYSSFGYQIYECPIRCVPSLPSESVLLELAATTLARAATTNATNTIANNELVPSTIVPATDVWIVQHQLQDALHKLRLACGAVTTAYALRES